MVQNWFVVYSDIKLPSRREVNKKPSCSIAQLKTQDPKHRFHTSLRFTLAFMHYDLSNISPQKSEWLKNVSSCKKSTFRTQRTTESYLYAFIRLTSALNDGQRATFSRGWEVYHKKQIPLISHKHIVPIILVLLFAANSLRRQSYQLAGGLRPQVQCFTESTIYTKLEKL